MKRKKFRSADAAKKARENQEMWNLLVKKYDVHKRDKAVAVDIPVFINPIVHRETTKIPDNFLQRLKRTPQDLVNRKELNKEMQIRENIAQKEIALKKQRVAPLYNKGGYQYISDGEDLTTIGKKI